VAQRVGRGIALLFHDHGTRREEYIYIYIERERERETGATAKVETWARRCFGL